jgi:hypothetical protein
MPVEIYVLEICPGLNQYGVPVGRQECGLWWQMNIETLTASQQL